VPRVSSSPTIRILGLDPALRTLGFAIVEQRGDEFTIQRLGLITTTNVDGLSVSESDFIATQHLAVELHRLMWEIDEVRAEGMSYPPNASSAAKIARSWGALAALSAVAFLHQIVVKQASPQAIRKAIGIVIPPRKKGQSNSSKAKTKRESKDAVRAAMEALFGKELIAKLLRAAGLKKKADQQHPIDALAAAVGIR
jgi:Holliday junction resolvasome RuvABC endonuclease subunit